MKRRTAATVSQIDPTQRRLAFMAQGIKFFPACLECSLDCEVLYPGRGCLNDRESCTKHAGQIAIY